MNHVLQNDIANFSLKKSLNVSIEKSNDLNVGPLDRVLILNSLL